MPWNVSDPVDLKMAFLSRLKRGERITELCREFGIARKTGHKLKNRYESMGAAGLLEDSRAPKRTPHKTPPEVAELIIGARKQHPDWGGKKLKDVLERELGRTFPAASTITGILIRNGLVQRKKRKRGYPTIPTTLRSSAAPNDIWSVDYKGQFRLGDGSYCYPLTITDHLSRYILCCEGMAAIRDEQAREVFHEVFREHGLPLVIRSDNGVPFASRGLAGLTKLSAYWLRLGIQHERIRPAHPEENGRHERMHLTLKRATTRPARHNLLQQQERFDEFVDEFNNERPHEALGMKRPAELYAPSKRPCPAKLPELVYLAHDDTLSVCDRGFIKLNRRTRLFLSAALAGQQVGVREEADGRWLVTFATMDLGYVERHGTFTDALHSESTASSTPPQPPQKHNNDDYDDEKREALA